MNALMWKYGQLPTKFYTIVKELQRGSCPHYNIKYDYNNY